jgi:predicted RNA methylase/proteasome lid subunit RPN8/RPN11
METLRTQDALLKWNALDTPAALDEIRAHLARTEQYLAEMAPEGTGAVAKRLQDMSERLQKQITALEKLETPDDQAARLARSLEDFVKQYQGKPLRPALQRVARAMEARADAFLEEGLHTRLWNRMDKGLVALRRLLTPVQAPGPMETPAPVVPSAPEAPALLPEQPLDQTASFRKLADMLYQAVAHDKPPANMRELQALADIAYSDSRGAGTYDPKDMYDALEVAVNRWARSQEFSPQVPLDEAIRRADALRAKIEQLPTQSVRTAESDALQQFSTPQDYAFAAAWVANIQPHDLVLEPSAGTGTLAQMAAAVVGSQQVYVNEIGARRIEALKMQHFPHLTTEDALFLNSLLHHRLPVPPTVVLMNPPFSMLAAQNRKDIMAGARHVEEALKLLVPGGRLVAIVGRGMGPETATFRSWFKKIGDKHTIRAVIEVAGKIYQKQGTNFATRLLVIDKGTPTAPGSTLTGDVTTIPDLLRLLEEVRNVRTQTAAVARPGGAIAPASGEGAAGPNREPAGATDAVGAPAGQEPAIPPSPRPPEPGVGEYGGVGAQGSAAVSRPSASRRPRGGRRPAARGLTPGQPGAGSPRPPEPTARPTEQPGPQLPPSEPSPERVPEGLTAADQLAQMNDAEFDAAFDQALQAMQPPAPAPVEPPPPRAQTPAPPQSLEPAAPAPAAPSAPPQAGFSMTEAERNAIRDILGSGVEEAPPPYEHWLEGVDPRKYTQLEPYLRTILDRTVQQGGTALDFFKGIIQEFGAAIKPYALQFRDTLAREKGQPQRPTPQEPQVPADSKTPEANEAELTDAIFEPYVPQRLQIAGAHPHPGPLVESAAMASVPSPRITYTPALPPEIITEGRLSLPQLEAVTYAGQAHSELLPDGRRKGWFDGDGCVAAGTRIYNPITGEHVPIEILAERGQSHIVLSLTKDGFVPHVAHAPFLKGRAKLYRVVIANGSTITVTGEHRFLTPQGWRTIAQGVRAGDWLACAESALSLDHEDDAYAREENVPSYWHRAEDCLAHYWPSASYPDDGRSHEVPNSAQEAFPSLSDVRGHSQPWSREGGQALLREYSHLHHAESLLSRNNFSPWESPVHALSEVPAPASFAQPWGQRPLTQWQSAAGSCMHQHAGAAPLHQLVPVDDSTHYGFAGLCHVALNDGQLSEQSHHGERQDLVCLSHFDKHQLFLPMHLLEQSSLVSSCNYYSRWHRIVHMEYVYEDVYYDMYVPGPENYLAEGIVHHNTGVGKGRIIAGILADNWFQGRTKALWISKNVDLLGQAQRDWSDVTGRPGADVFSLAKPATAVDAQIHRENGILFVPYDTLKNVSKKDPTKSRLKQIVEWLGPEFDGAIIFDESHLMGNNMAVQDEGGFGKEASQRARAGQDLRDALPKARVTYLSATGATEVSNLGYLDRLGLWGPKTPFPTKHDFVFGVGSGGVAAMELVARDMKAMGVYMARSLSFDGVQYDRIEMPFSEAQVASYNRIAAAWQHVLTRIDAALDLTDGTNARQKKNALNLFWSSHQRFFNQLITAMKTPAMIAHIDTYIHDPNGDAALIQLVNTNKATQDRRLAQMQEGDQLEDLQLSPMDILMEYVHKSFPVIQQVEVADEDGNTHIEPLIRDGKPVENPEAVAVRDQLLDELAILQADIPPGPLEQLLDHYGPDAVAEVTGRNQRLVYRQNAEGQMERVKESRTEKDIRRDVSAFMDDTKRILVYSGKGDTGMDYHASLKVKNQRLRHHYALQPGWQADKAVQGFGRSHRTNQRQAPIYHLITTNLPGERRFTSSIARRLDQLGALGRGQRQASGQGLFSERDNLESQYARDALQRYFKDLVENRDVSLPYEEFARQSGFGDRLIDKETGGLRRELPGIEQFLNRLLSFTVEGQHQVFDDFSKRLDQVIELAIQQGTFDVGMETIRADKISKVQERVIATDATTGAETKYVELKVAHKTQPLTWDKLPARIAAAQRNLGGGKLLQYAVNKRSGKIYALLSALPALEKTQGALIEQYRRIGVAGETLIPTVDVQTSSYDQFIDPIDAEQLWTRDVAALPPYQEHTEHLMTGVLLPHWDKLPQGMSKVYRLQTDAGERMIGRVIPPKDIKGVLSNFGVTLEGKEAALPKYTPEEAIARVLTQGNTLRLANGWRLQPSRIGGAPRVELTGPGFSHRDELTADGLIFERPSYTAHWFVPTGVRGPEVLRRILEHRPIVEEIPHKQGVETPNAAYGAGERPRLPGDLTYARRPRSSPADFTRAEDAIRRLETGSRDLRSTRGGMVRPGGAPPASPDFPTAAGPAGTQLLGKSVAARAYIDALRQTGAAAFVGQVAKTPEDIAVLAQAVRDPNMERLFWIFTKGDQAVDTVVVSSRLPGSSTMFPTGDRPGLSRAQHIALLQKQMQHVGANGYFLVHNHPSGDPTPSAADIAMTHQIARDMPGFKGHVVINSGKYASLGAGGEVQLFSLDRATLWAETGGFDPFLETPPSELPHPLNDQMIRSVQDVARLAQKVNIPDGYVLAFYRSAKGEVRGIELLPASLFMEPSLRATLVKHLKARRLYTGAQETLTYYDGPDPDIQATARELYQTGAIRDHFTQQAPEAEQSLVRQAPGDYGKYKPSTESPGYLVESPTKKAS